MASERGEDRQRFTQTGGNDGQRERRCDIRVTVEDLVDGTSETAEIPPDSYIVIAGAKLEITGEQWYANGTRIVTLKRRPREAPDGQ